MIKKKEKLWQCPECGFFYKEREIAEQCREWCSKHKSCNLEIIKHAVNPK
jgi:methionyl-tRNA synthetase